MQRQYQITEDITIDAANNSYINSTLRVPEGTYFEVTIYYPKGYISYSLHFWQEVDGEPLDHQWNRNAVAVETNDMGSRQAALQKLFNELLPELKNASKKV